MTGPLCNRIIFILSLAGSGVALLMTLAHAKLVSLPCGPSQGCEYVALHPAAQGLGIPGLQSIPTAVFGLGMYLFLVAISFLRVANPDESRNSKLPLIQLAVSITGVVISGWLTYLEAFVIHHWCRYCVASAIIILLICITAIIEQLNRSRGPFVPASLPDGELS